MGPGRGAGGRARGPPFPSRDRRGLQRGLQGGGGGCSSAHAADPAAAQLAWRGISHFKQQALALAPACPVPQASCPARQRAAGRRAAGSEWPGSRGLRAWLPPAPEAPTPLGAYALERAGGGGERGPRRRTRGRSLPPSALRSGLGHRGVRPPLPPRGEFRAVAFSQLLQPNG